MTAEVQQLRQCAEEEREAEALREERDEAGRALRERLEDAEQELAVLRR
eukprot:CAMPEP_0198432956 /NCGR_PEP_ID=MMETSP1452-20131203/24733_1 /TAXON_ID=1181717 /ORGANISM="Synchroma pusillum, Strain CCMP3072" /LENGTH=48 /DNA_ID= /DNA_START= /DNA_END= /DNA_ORIENTATION=